MLCHLTIWTAKLSNRFFGKNGHRYAVIYFIYLVQVILAIIANMWPVLLVLLEHLNEFLKFQP